MKIPTHEDTCPGCDDQLSRGQTHCACGRPTQYATFDDRAAYEVSQWRAYRERIAADA